MPNPAVDTIFKATIAAGFTDIPTIGIDGIEEPPTSGSSFVVLQYPVVNGNKPVLGRKFFEDGAARIVVNAERSRFSDAASMWVPALASLFRDRNLGSGLQTFTPSGPVINDAIDNGQIVEFSLIVPYRYQFED